MDTKVFRFRGYLSPLCLCFTAPASAQVRNRVVAPNLSIVFLVGHHPSLASTQNDLGPVPSVGLTTSRQ